MTNPAPAPAQGLEPPQAHAPVQPQPPRPARATLDYTQLAGASRANAAASAGIPVGAPPAAQAPHHAPHHDADGTGEQDRRLADAFEAVQDLYFLGTPAAGLDFVVKLLGELLPCEACSASLYDMTTDQLRCVAAEGPGSDALRARASTAAAGLVAAAAKGRADHLVVNSVVDDLRFLPAVDGFGELPVRDLVYFPLTVGVQLVGMLQLVNRMGRRGFSVADIAVGAYVASQAAKFVIDHRSRRDG
jgi:hypothetical protein